VNLTFFYESQSGLDEQYVKAFEKVLAHKGDVAML